MNIPPAFVSLCLLVLVAAPGLAMAAPDPAPAVEAPEGAPISLTIKDGFIVEAPKNTKASLEAVVDRVRRQTKQNIVLMPGMSGIVIQDLVLRGADMAGFGRAVELVTGNRLVFSPEANNLWGFHWSPNRPQRTLEVFNLSGYFQQIASPPKAGAEAGPQNIARAEVNPDEAPATQVYPLRYARAQEVGGTVSAYMKSNNPGFDPFAQNNRGSNLQIDTRTNSLIITERPTQMKIIGALIASLDRPPQELSNEAMAAQITGINNMVREALLSLNPQRSNDDLPEMQFHPGTQTLVVVGTAQDLEVARRIIAALPGQSAATRLQTAVAALQNTATEGAEQGLQHVTQLLREALRQYSADENANSTFRDLLKLYQDANQGPAPFPDLESDMPKLPPAPPPQPRRNPPTSNY